MPGAAPSPLLGRTRPFPTADCKGAHRIMGVPVPGQGVVGDREQQAASPGGGTAAETAGGCRLLPTPVHAGAGGCDGDGRSRLTKEEDDISNPLRRLRRRELSQFSPEEADRIVRRRQRNKVAATKCRHKRHSQHEQLVKELQGMECENTSLTYEIRQLQRQRQALSDVLRHHQVSCPAHTRLSEADAQALSSNTLLQVSPEGPYPLPYAR